MPERDSNRARAVLLIFLCLTLIQGVFSQGDWESKPVSSWDHKDVFEVLNRSDWVQLHTKPWDVLRVVEGNITATVMLRSSLPVRLAMFRDAQLEADYDKMSDKEKSEFDKENIPIYTCPACEKFYVVSVVSKDVIPWTRKFVEDRKKFITISNGQGDVIELAEYDFRYDRKTAELIFFFPRPADPGKFLSKDSETLIFKLDFRVEDLRGYPVREARFAVSKIVRDGIVVF